MAAGERLTGGRERRSIYLVEEYYGPALGFAYREVDDDRPEFTDRETLVRFIAERQFDDVASVHFVDFAAGTVKDVTSEIIGDVENMLATIRETAR